MDLRLEDSVAVVSGGNRGLGKAIVEAFLAEGMQVLAIVRSDDGLKPFLESHPDALRVHHWEGASSAHVPAAIRAAYDAFGRIDVVVNNAGFPGGGRFQDTSKSAWRSIFEANLFTPMRMIQEVLGGFIMQGSGKVINIASTSGLRGKPGLAPYSASKGALIRLTEAIANEVAVSNVQVNAIAPGAFTTEAQAPVLEDPTLFARRLRKIPAGRMGEPGEIGPLALYLASQLSDYVTGSTFVIDGGEVAKL